jgi:prepilin-type N-terminal cleavage/methylation domain-containing protein
MRQFWVKDMTKASSTSGVRPGFSLAEVLAALTISAMVLAAVVAIYSRAQNSAAAIVRKLDSTRLSTEVLQAITEDLDTITVPARIQESRLRISSITVSQPLG